MPEREPLRVAGLFSGIGGLEVGLTRAGHEVVSLCESWAPARAVLAEHFAGVTLDEDIRALDHLAEADVVAAGFPCTDPSQVGRTGGITGAASGLVNEVFDLVAERPPSWLLLENVANMLYLRGGEGMELITGRLEALGYDWAWRVVDSRSFGVPQRRRRVFVLAGRHADPASVLFGDDVGCPPPHLFARDAFGFSWTEGNRGLGWAVDATPTLKGGSTASVPSPPAIWLPGREHQIVVPSIDVAEQLQGFAAGWTTAAPTRDRWKLVGNAVTVDVAEWVGRRLSRPTTADADTIAVAPLGRERRKPKAAFRRDGKSWEARVSEWPVRTEYQHLGPLVDAGGTAPLSRRATSGFRDRLRRSRLRYDQDFMAALDRHIDGFD